MSNNWNERKPDLPESKECVSSKDHTIYFHRYQFNFWFCFDSWNQKAVQALEMCPAQNMLLQVQKIIQWSKEIFQYRRTCNSLCNSSDVKINIFKLQWKGSKRSCSGCKKTCLREDTVWVLTSVWIIFNWLLLVLQFFDIKQCQNSIFSQAAYGNYVSSVSSPEAEV